MDREQPIVRTTPRRRFPEGVKVDSTKLAGGRYGTEEMCDIWGPEKTFEYSLQAQGQAALTLAKMHPSLISMKIADEINDKANLENINPDRIRELEDKTKHDVIAINTALGEIVNAEAKPYINKFKTSADTTQPARALQLKRSLEVIAETTENLRDILIDKSLEWINVPHMDTTHGYDALPTVAGRPFAHYVEMLETGLGFLKYVYTNSIIGKWGDVTGNHHSASSMDVDGIELQKKYCQDLDIGFMDAAAQIPGLEFEADVAYSIARIGMTVENVAKYIAEGRKDDVGLFVYSNPDKRKGSSGMPHKDAKGGNPTDEEQAVSVANKLIGFVTTALSNCDMSYARTLYASANARLDFEDSFKFMDHNVRNLSATIYHMQLNQDRSIERVLRSRGVVTSPQVLTYLTSQGMPWRETHDLLGKLAKQAWDEKREFYEVLIRNEDIGRVASLETLGRLTNPLEYIGQSKEIIMTVAKKYHHVKTLTL